MEIKKISNGMVSGYSVTTGEEESSSPIPEHFQRALDTLRGAIPIPSGIHTGSARDSFEDRSNGQTSLDRLFESNPRSSGPKSSESSGKDGIKWGNGGGGGV